MVLSNQIQELRKSGILPYAMMSVNDCLREIYQDQTGQNDWKTFKQWKEEGFRVMKGEKGFPLWAKPLVSQEDEQGNIETEQLKEGELTYSEKVSYWPMCYLFHAGQVQNDQGLYPSTWQATLPKPRALMLPAPGQSSYQDQEAA